MLTIGVIISFIGSMLLLLPILHLRDKMGSQKEAVVKSKANGKQNNNSLLSKGLQAFTKGVLRYSIPVLLIVFIVAGLGFYVDNKVGVETDIESFMPQDMEALQDIHIVRDNVGSTDQMAIYMRDDNILQEKNISWIKEITKDINEKYSDVVVDVKSIETLVSNLSTSENLSTEEYIDYVNGISLSTMWQLDALILKAI